MKNILVVDDDIVSHMIITALVKKHNTSISIFKAHNGYEALEVLKGLESSPDTKIDLILLDLNMPKMNGFEFLEIYSGKEDQTSTVVIHTSSETQEDMEKASSYDFVKGYCLKPATLDDIVKLENFCAS